MVREIEVHLAYTSVSDQPLNILTTLFIVGRLSSLAEVDDKTFGKVILTHYGCCTKFIKYCTCYAQRMMTGMW